MKTVRGVGRLDVKELWSELETLGLKEVRRKFHQGAEDWMPGTAPRQRIEDWIEFKESELRNRRALRAEIASGVAILIAILAFVRSC